MDFGTLHPVSIEFVQAYLARDETTLIVEQLDDANSVRSRKLNSLTFGLAFDLSERQPVFAGTGFSLSAWEARVDRGIGMMMRPPSRLFLDSGLEAPIARTLDIRLDLAGTAMGGAYVPPHLIDQCADVVDRHLERSIKRMIDAGMDASQMQSTMTEALSYASSTGLGLYEASGVLDPYDASTWPAGASVVTGSKNAALLARIDQAIQPEKEDGFVKRSLRKFGIG